MVLPTLVECNLRQLIGLLAGTFIFPTIKNSRKAEKTQACKLILTILQEVYNNG